MQLIIPFPFWNIGLGYPREAETKPFAEWLIEESLRFQVMSYSDQFRGLQNKQNLDKQEMCLHNDANGANKIPHTNLPF